MCTALVEHRADLEPFIDGMTFEEYVNQMALPSTWGGEPELAIAADVLGLPIVVYQKEGVRTHTCITLWIPQPGHRAVTVHRMRGTVLHSVSPGNGSAWWQ